MMFVRYDTTPVGPYQELALMPGLRRWRGQSFYQVGPIWVDLPASRRWGRANWGIPKQLATLRWRADADAARFTAQALPDGPPFCSAGWRTLGPAWLPLPAWLLRPWVRPLLQAALNAGVDTGPQLETSLQISARAQLIWLQHLETAPPQLPTPARLRLWRLGLRLVDLRLAIGVPRKHA